MAYMSQENKKSLMPAIKAVLKKYKMKANVSVRHHSSLVCNIVSGEMDLSGCFSHGDGYAQVNQYHIDKHLRQPRKNHQQIFLCLWIHYTERIVLLDNQY